MEANQTTIAKTIQTSENITLLQEVQRQTDTAEIFREQFQNCFTTSDRARIFLFMTLNLIP